LGGGEAGGKQADRKSRFIVRSFENPETVVAMPSEDKTKKSSSVSVSSKVSYPSSSISKNSSVDGLIPLLIGKAIRLARQSQRMSVVKEIRELRHFVMSDRVAFCQSRITTAVIKKTNAKR
jgi:hypothetical protein